MGKLKLPRFVHRKHPSNPSWSVVTYPCNQSSRQAKTKYANLVMRCMGGAAESGVVVRVEGLVSTGDRSYFRKANKLKLFFDSELSEVGSRCS